ncbi:MAG: sensor histidine kinase, partial [Clostridia bacterium]|nr:sensor histidine kinase [Clostridia bacterium]
AARHVRVRLAATPERLLLSVRDDGAGADRFVPGMGLGEMTARVQAVGGSIRFRTAPGAGFEVEIGVRRR